MRILIVRHADPDYDIDSLTETGWREAEALSERIAKLDIRKFYCSPLGRARDTASLTLKKMNRDAEICPWLREFSPPLIQYPGNGEEHICWDWLPADWTACPELYDRERWLDHPAMVEGNVREYHDYVIGELDKLLAGHGYVRKQGYYRAVSRNRDTIVLFCHFGVECVLLGHMLNLPTFALWHGTVAAPSSVTTVYTEERRDGIASFRMQSFGDISHLYVKGMEPSFAARFCETWDCPTERKD